MRHQDLEPANYLSTQAVVHGNFLLVDAAVWDRKLPGFCETDDEPASRM